MEHSVGSGVRMSECLNSGSSTYGLIFSKSPNFCKLQYHFYKMGMM